jgi:hypothetical protein
MQYPVVDILHLLHKLKAHHKIYVNVTDAAIAHFGDKCTIFREHRMNCWESFYIPAYQLQGLLIQEKFTPDLNPLFTLIQETDG